MLGVCYYPEHWPEDAWAEDARRMADLGLTWVRIGEFAWSRFEPARGRFDWGWLDRAIDTLARAGLEVVMCTPTAAPPKWLVDERPEILPWDAEGRVRGFGSRRHVCLTSPAWREETERICAIVAGRYGRHAAVAGWQLDNEYGCHDTVLSYAPHCRTAFRDWLRQRHGTVRALNEAWGTVFWSQEYADFDQIDLPVSTVTEANPAHLLDYRRFASDQVAAYHRLQAGIVRSRSPGRFIAHNFMGFFTGFDHFAVGRELDVAAWDSYPLGFTDQRMGLDDGERARFARTGHPDAAAFHHDLYRAVGRGRWWVMEQQPGPVNWADHNPSPRPGMVRLWTWEALAHGAETVSYFRWRQVPFAQEQMHAGLHRPDGRPDDGAGEARRVAEELARISCPPRAAEPAPLAADGPASRRAPVALVYDYPAAWLFDIQPQGKGFDYRNLVMAFYTAARRLGLDVDVAAPGAELSGYALVMAPSLPIAEDAALAALRGTDAVMVLGPRSGSRTADFRIPPELPPGPFKAHLPLTVTRVESLPAGVPDEVCFHGRRYPVRRWRERLDGAASATAAYADGGVAAAAAGRWHYLGFWPDPEFLADYLERLLTARGVLTRRLPETLRLRRRDDLTFAFNYGGEAVRAPAPDGAEFVLGGPEIGAADLAAWRTPGSIPARPAR